MKQYPIYERSATPHEGNLARKVRTGAAVFCGAVSVSVLLGWTAGVMALTQILPGLSAMNPATAIAISIAGAAMALHERAGPRTLWTLSAIILCIGVTKLLYLAGIHQFRIDQLLFSSKLDDAIGVPPNRMAPNTALSLVITAFAIAMSKTASRRHVVISQALCCIIIAITLFAIIGYILGVVTLYKVRAFNPMAVHTACALMIIAAGILSTSPRAGLMRVITSRGPAGQLCRRVMPLVVLVPVIVGLLRLKGEQLGYYDPSTGVALLVFANVVVTSSLLMVSIALLYRSDMARRSRELTVRRSEEEFRLAEELGRVGHWRIDLGTNNLKCSAELVRICGLPTGSSPARGEILALHHPDDASAHRRCTERALRDGTGWDESRRITRPDGELRIIRSHGAAEKNAHGEILSLFGVFVDITELENARQQAEAATAAKADFLANMSHEIRTPLNSIIGFTDLMLDDNGLSEVHRRQLRLVKNSGRALLTVVNDILDFSKMEAGKVELSARPFDLAHLVQSTISIIRQSAEIKGLALTVQLSADSGRYFIGDDSRIQQVLLNLLSNAIKFTRDGSVTLTVKCIPAGDTNVATFVIADTGIGISANDEHRLFREFSQATSSISREHGGTGLGLAISKKVVRLMGGGIGFRQANAGGSEFWFNVPLQVTSEAQVRCETARPVSARSRRILVVEDVAANRELAMAMLVRCGHEVVIAANGREALAAVQQEDFDLILMDIQMPVMDGVTAAKLIRMLPGKARGTPIIALTANILPEQIETFRRAGMNDHVGKPIDLAELTAAIVRNAPETLMGRVEGVAPEPPVEARFDEEAYRRLAAMLPADRLAVHAETLQSAMTDLEECDGPSDVWRNIAHSLVTQAGMFGLVELSDLSRDLENGLEEDCPPETVVSAVRLAIASARLRLAEFQCVDRRSGLTALK